MKKSFFKKLSFVMAAAMTMALVAPAAGAFGATAPKLNSAKKYLYLDVEDKNDYNFNITTTKGSGWNYLWESSDEDVAVVDESNGVTTATGVGSAKITVFITDKDGEEVGEASATVIVKDNIADVKIANKPEKDTLAVGAPFDFNRTFTTVSGSTTVTSSVTRWTVTPAEGAAITSAGVFTADKAGKYTVTANAFQSTEKYNTWKADPVANAGLVLDSDSYDVTVAPTMKAAQQLTFTTAKLTFDADMSKELTASNLKAYRVIAGVSTPVDLLVKKVSFDATGKEATVEMYVDFIGGENYKFVYGTMEAGFTAAKAEVEAVKSVVLTTKEAVYTQGQKALEVKLYNADGVDITTTTLLARVTFALTNNVGYLSGSNLVLFAKGDVANVKATFHTYKYDANYQEIVVEGTGNVVAVDATSYGLGSTVQFTLGTANPDWTKAQVATLAAGDTGYKAYARVRSTKTDVEEYYYSYPITGTNVIADGKFTFSSSNQEVLIVDATGIVYPVKAGTAIIICNYDGKAVATFPVEVKAARSAAVFSIDKNAVTLSNSPSVADTATVKLTLKDELGANFFENGSYQASKVEIVALKSNPDLGAGFGPVSFANVNNTEITVSGANQTKGVWTYQIKAYDKVAILVVTIQEPTYVTNDTNYVDDVVYYRLTLDKSAVDRAVAKDSAVKSVTPSLIGYASNGVAVFKTDWTGDFSYTVTKTDGTAVTFTGSNLLDGTIEVAKAGSVITSPTAAVSGPAIDLVTGTSVAALDKDITYVVTAKKGTEVKGTATFTVTDSKAAPTYTYEKAEVTLTNNSVLQAVRDCFKVTLSGTDIADTELYGVTYVVGNAAAVTDTANDDTVVDGTTILVKSVKFIETFSNTDGTTYAVEYTANIDRTITIK